MLTEGEEEETYVSRNEVEDRDAVFESEGEDEGTRTAGTTTWSPTSSPGRVSEGTSTAMRKEMDLHVAVARMRSFESVREEEDDNIRGGRGWAEEIVSVRPNRTSVGVAF